MTREISLGSGQVQHTGAPLLHFGSPSGTEYQRPDNNAPTEPTEPVMYLP